MYPFSPSTSSTLFLRRAPTTATPATPVTLFLRDRRDIDTFDKTRLENLENEKRQLSDNLQARNEEIKSLGNTLMRQEAEFKALSDQLKEASQAQISDLTSRIDQLAQRNEEQKQLILAKIVEVNALTTSLQTKNDEITALVGKFRLQNKEKRELQKLLGKEKSRVDEILRQVQNSTRNLNNELDLARTQLETVNTQMNLILQNNQQLLIRARISEKEKRDLEDRNAMILRVMEKNRTRQESSEKTISSISSISSSILSGTRTLVSAVAKDATTASVGLLSAGAAVLGTLTGVASGFSNLVYDFYKGRDFNSLIDEFFRNVEKIKTDDTLTEAALKELTGKNQVIAQILNDFLTKIAKDLKPGDVARYRTIFDKLDESNRALTERVERFSELETRLMKEISDLKSEVEVERNTLAKNWEEYQTRQTEQEKKNNELVQLEGQLNTNLENLNNKKRQLEDQETAIAAREALVSSAERNLETLKKDTQKLLEEKKTLEERSIPFLEKLKKAKSEELAGISRQVLDAVRERDEARRKYDEFAKKTGDVSIVDAELAEKTRNVARLESELQGLGTQKSGIEKELEDKNKLVLALDEKEKTIARILQDNREYLKTVKQELRQELQKQEEMKKKTRALLSELENTQKTLRENVAIQVGSTAQTRTAVEKLRNVQEQLQKDSLALETVQKDLANRQEEIKKVNTFKDEIERQLAAQEQEVVLKNSELEGVNRKKEEQEELLAQKEKELRDLENKRDELQQRIDLLEVYEKDQLKNVQDKIQAKEDEKMTLELSIAELKGLREKGLVNLNSLQADIQDKRKILEDADGSIQVRIKELNEREEALNQYEDRMKQETRALEEKLRSDYKEKEEELNRALKDLEGRKKQLKGNYEKEKQKLQKQFEAETSQIKRILEEERSKLRQEIEKEIEDIKTLKLKLEETSAARLREIEASLSSKETDLNKARDELDEIIRIEKQKARESDAVLAQLNKQLKEVDEERAGISRNEEQLKKDQAELETKRQDLQTMEKQLQEREYELEERGMTRAAILEDRRKLQRDMENIQEQLTKLANQKADFDTFKKTSKTRLEEEEIRIRKEIKQKMVNLEVQEYVFSRQRQRELEDLKSQRGTLQILIDTKDREILEVQGMKRSLESRSEYQETEILRLKEKEALLDAERTSLREKMDALNKRERELNEKEEEIKKRETTNNARIAEVNNRLTRQNAEIRQREQAVQSSREQIAVENRSLISKKAELREIELAQSRQDVVLGNRQNELRNKEDSLKWQANELTRQVTRQEENLKKKEDELNKKEDEIEKIRQDLEENRNRQEDLEKERTEALNKIEQERQALSRAREFVDQEKRTNEELVKYELEKTEEARRSFLEERSKVNQNLQENERKMQLLQAKLTAAETGRETELMGILNRELEETIQAKTALELERIEIERRREEYVSNVRKLEDANRTLETDKQNLERENRARVRAFENEKRELQEKEERLESQLQDRILQVSELKQKQAELDKARIDLENARQGLQQQMQVIFEQQAELERMRGEIERLDAKDTELQYEIALRDNKLEDKNTRLTQILNKQTKLISALKSLLAEKKTLEDRVNELMELFSGTLAYKDSVLLSSLEKYIFEVLYPQDKDLAEKMLSFINTIIKLPVSKEEKERILSAFRWRKQVENNIERLRIAPTLKLYLRNVYKNMDPRLWRKKALNLNQYYTDEGRISIPETDTEPTKNIKLELLGLILDVLGLGKDKRRVRAVLEAFDDLDTAQTQLSNLNLDQDKRARLVELFLQFRRDNPELWDREILFLTKWLDMNIASDKVVSLLEYIKSLENSPKMENLDEWGLKEFIEQQIEELRKQQERIATLQQEKNREGELKEKYFMNQVSYEKMIRDLRDRIAELEANRATLIQERGRFAMDSSLKDIQLAQQQEQIDAFGTEIRSREDYQAGFNRLTGELGQRNQELSNLRSRFDIAVQERIRELQERIQELQEQLKDKGEKEEKEEKTKNEIDSRESTIDLERNELIKQNTSLNSEKLKLQAELKSLNSEKLKLQAELNSLNSEKLKLQAELSELQYELKQNRKELDKLLAENAQLSEKNKELSAENAQLQARVQLREQELVAEKSKRDCDDIKKENDALKKLNKELEQKLASVKENIEKRAKTQPQPIEHPVQFIQRVYKYI